jgi:hypothetical protein
MAKIASKRKMAKRKASIAVREIINAARKYIEAEGDLERVMLEERKQARGET